MRVDDKLLTSALKICNENAMNRIPDIIDRHEFSRGFQRKIERMNKAHKKFRGSLGIERVVRYTTRIATIMVCFIVLNAVVIRAFHVDIWNVVYDKIGAYTRIGFTQKTETETIDIIDTKLKIVSVPDGYKAEEEYFSENMSVQNFRSDAGTITYTEGLITESANVDILEETEGKKLIVGAKEVTLIDGENNITAFFKDNKYYHIVEIQGADANEKFMKDIIEKLEVQ